MSGRPTAAISLLYTESPFPPMITYLPSLLCMVADGTTPANNCQVTHPVVRLAVYSCPNRYREAAQENCSHSIVMVQANRIMVIRTKTQ